MNQRLQIWSSSPLVMALVACICTLICVDAHADIFKFVSYECRPIDNVLLIKHWVTDDDKGVEILKSRALNTWSVDYMSLIQRQCKLSDGVYQIDIGAYRGNDNPVGECGAFFAAYVKIRKGKRVIFNEALENTNCLSPSDKPVITQIVIGVGREPSIHSVPWTEFYN